MRFISEEERSLDALTPAQLAALGFAIMAWPVHKQLGQVTFDLQKTGIYGSAKMKKLKDDAAFALCVGCCAQGNRVARLCHHVCVLFDLRDEYESRKECTIRFVMAAMKLDQEVVEMIEKMSIFEQIRSDLQDRYNLGLKVLYAKPQVDVRRLASEIGLTDKKQFQTLKDEALAFMLESREYPEILGWEAAFTTLKNA